MDDKKSLIEADKDMTVGRVAFAPPMREGGVLPQTPLPEGTKDTNPKDAVGCRKVYFSTISAPVMAEVGLGMLEGALKYGRHNYREKGVRASVYYDALRRHIEDWWEGEDIDPDSELHHVTKAICTLVVLRDAMIQNKLTDDRPPKSPKGWMQKLNKRAAELIDKYPNPAAAVTELTKEE